MKLPAGVYRGEGVRGRGERSHSAKPPLPDRENCSHVSATFSVTGWSKTIVFIDISLKIIKQVVSGMVKNHNVFDIFTPIMVKNHGVY